MKCYFKIYEGMIVLISHDQEFVRSLAILMIIAVTPNTVIDLNGNNVDYLCNQGI